MFSKIWCLCTENKFHEGLITEFGIDASALAHDIVHHWPLCQEKTVSVTKLVRLLPGQLYPIKHLLKDELTQFLQLMPRNLSSTRSLFLVGLCSWLQLKCHVNFLLDLNKSALKSASRLSLGYIVPDSFFHNVTDDLFFKYMDILGLIFADISPVKFFEWVLGLTIQLDFFMDDNGEKPVYPRFSGLTKFFIHYKDDDYTSFLGQLAKKNASFLMLFLMHGVEHSILMRSLVDQFALELASVNEDILFWMAASYPFDYKHPLCLAASKPELILGENSNALSTDPVLRSFALKNFLNNSINIDIDSLVPLHVDDSSMRVLLMDSSEKSTAICKQLSIKSLGIYEFCINIKCGILKDIPSISSSMSRDKIYFYCKFGILKALRSLNMSKSTSKSLIMELFKHLPGMSWYRKKAILADLGELGEEMVQLMIDCMEEGSSYLVKHLPRKFTSIKHLMLACRHNIILVPSQAFNFERFYDEIHRHDVKTANNLFRHINLTSSTSVSTILGSYLRKSLQKLLDDSFLRELTNEEKALIKREGTLPLPPKTILPPSVDKKKELPYARVTRINDILLMRARHQQEIDYIFDVFGPFVAEDVSNIEVIWRFISDDNLSHLVDTSHIISHCTTSSEGIWLLSPMNHSVDPKSLRLLALPFLVKKISNFHYNEDFDSLVDFLAIRTAQLSFEMLRYLLERVFEYFDSNPKLELLGKVLVLSHLDQAQQISLQKLVKKYILYKEANASNAAVAILSKLTNIEADVMHRLFVHNFALDSSEKSMYNVTPELLDFEGFMQILNDIDVSNAYFDSLSKLITEYSSKLTDNSFLCRLKDAYHTLLEKRLPSIVRGSSEGIDLTSNNRLSVIRSILLRKFAPDSDLPVIKFCVETVFFDPNDQVRQLAFMTCKTISTHKSIKYLSDFLSKLDSCAKNDNARIFIIILISILTEDAGDRIRLIKESFLSALRIPSESVQSAISDCLFDLKCSVDEDFKRHLLEDLFGKKTTFGIRKGAAYGLAPLLTDYDILLEPFKAISNNSRLGSLFVVEILSRKLKLSFQSWATRFFPFIIASCSDPRAEIREAAEEAAYNLIEHSMGKFGLRTILPIILDELEEKPRIYIDNLSQYDLPGVTWKAKVNFCMWLKIISASMVHETIHSLFAKMITVLAETISLSSHAQVQTVARDALISIAGIVKNPEMKILSSFIVRSVADPTLSELSADALRMITETSFSHAIDSTSLSLLLAFLSQCISRKDRESANFSVIRQQVCIVIGSISSYLIDPMLLVQFGGKFKNILFSVLSDSLFGNQFIASKAIASLARVLLRLESTSISSKNTAHAISSELILGELVDKLKNQSLPMQIGVGMAIAELLAVKGPKHTAAFLETYNNFDIGFLAVVARLPEAYETNCEDLASLYSICKLDEQIPRILNVLEDHVNFGDISREMAIKAVKNQVIRHHKIIGLERVMEILLVLIRKSHRIKLFALQLLNELLLVIIPDKKIGFGCEHLLSHGLISRRTLSRLLSLVLVSRYHRTLLEGPTNEERDLSSSVAIKMVSSNIWKALVFHTPKTVMEILPILCQHFILATPSEHESCKACILDMIVRLGEKFYVPLLDILENYIDTPAELLRVVSWMCDFQGFQSDQGHQLVIPEEIAKKISSKIVRFVRLGLGLETTQEAANLIIIKVLSLLTITNSLKDIIDDSDEEVLSKLLDLGGSNIAAILLKSSSISPKVLLKSPLPIITEQIDILLQNPDKNCLAVLVSRILTQTCNDSLLFSKLLVWMARQKGIEALLTNVFHSIADSNTKVQDVNILVTVWTQYKALIMRNIQLLIEFCRCIKAHQTISLLYNDINKLPIEAGISDSQLEQVVAFILLPLLEESKFSNVLEILRGLNSTNLPQKSLVSLMGAIIRLCTIEKNTILPEIVQVLLMTDANIGKLRAFFPQLLHILKSDNQETNQKTLSILFKLLSSRQQASLLESIPLDSFSTFINFSIPNLDATNMNLILSRVTEERDILTPKVTVLLNERCIQLGDSDIIDRMKQIRNNGAFTAKDQ